MILLPHHQFFKRTHELTSLTWMITPLLGNFVMRELKECRASNKELVKEFSNVREEIEDIKEYTKKNDEKISEVQTSVTQVSEDLTERTQEGWCFLGKACDVY